MRRARSRETPIWARGWVAEGPAPTPPGLLLAAGETRPSRINREAPQPTGAPRVPRGLGRAERIVWRRVVASMPVGVVTTVDEDLLRAYCEAVILYRQAFRELVGGGILVQIREDRGLVENPAAQLVRDSRDAIRLLGRESRPDAGGARRAPNRAHPTERSHLRDDRAPAPAAGSVGRPLNLSPEQILMPPRDPLTSKAAR